MNSGHKDRGASSSLAPFVGRVLVVDLTTGVSNTMPTLPFAAQFLGGRGLAARLAWDLIPPGFGAFDPRNPLLFMPGALVGTPAPSSGRVTISGLSPQAFPHEWYTRANLGGHWGPELKYAGYDGLVVTGQAPRPVYLYIEDDQVELRDATHLWGLGLVETQRKLQQELVPGARVLAIGPAGENRCRFAIIATGTESAAGQGGFGAVMGSKNLKAIAVRGHQGVAVAHPAEMLRRSRLVVERIFGCYGRNPLSEPGASLPEGERIPPCTYQCPRACGNFYQRVPGVVERQRTYGGHIFCSAPMFGGSEWSGVKLGFEAGFELAQLCNDFGLNHWEFVFGLVPWLLRCQAQGILRRINGDELDFRDPQVWVRFITNIALRREWGAVFAEGGPRAAAILGQGQDLIGDVYPAWGQASHWDGHGSFPSPHFPYWLVTALQWAMDTRDPMGGGHGYTTNIVGLLDAVKPGDEAARERLCAVGQRLYGSRASVDPYSGYEGKAAPAVFHQDRGALKDSLGICDNIFPLLTDPKEADPLVRVDGVEGQYLEHYLFEAASDLGLAREDFYRAGTRVFTAERLLAVRNWGRSRETDETIIPYLQRPEGAASPFLGKPMALDAARFGSLLGEYYALRGWDPVTGRPTADTLSDLGMDSFTVSGP